MIGDLRGHCNSLKISYNEFKESESIMLLIYLAKIMQ